MRDVTAFSVGDILKLSFSVYFTNLPLFLPLSLIAFAPSFAGFFLGWSSIDNLPVGGSTGSDVPNFEFWQAMREVFVAMLCGIWLQAGLAYGVVRHLRGGTPGFFETFVQSMRRLLAAVLVVVVVAVVTVGGLLLLVVPGVIVALVLWVALPVAVVERIGLRSLQRSAQLTEGYKGQIFGLALILFVLDWVVQAVVFGVLSTATTHTVLVFMVVQVCVIVWSGVWATAVSVTYHDLRVLKEGVDTRDVSQVFE